MTTIYLKPHKEESLKRFHPWVFSGAISRVVLDASHKASAPEEGEMVVVVVPLLFIDIEFTEAVALMLLMESSW